MKRLAICLLLILMASPVYGEDLSIDWTKQYARLSTPILCGNASTTNPCSGYLVCQGFEGTGYDNSETWTEYIPGSSVVNEDYTTTALVGSQSLYLYNGSSWDSTRAYTSFTPSGNAYAYAQVRFKTIANSLYFMILEASSTDVAGVQYVNSSTVRLDCGTSNNSDSYSISTDTTYHVWLEYQKGTGSNAICRLYLSTTSSKPGTATITITAGSGTGDADGINLDCSGATSGREIIFDKIRVSSSSIGSDPQ